MTTARKILFVDLFTYYGQGTVLAKKIARSFEAIGYVPVILDVESPNAAQALRNCIQERKGFLFSFSMGWGISKSSKIEGRYIHEWMDIPHFACFADHPLYKHSFIDFTLKDTVYGFTDRTHATFCEQFYGTGNYIFFPHFSLVDLDQPVTEKEFFSRDKSLFFSGSATIMDRKWTVNLNSISQNKAVSILKEEGVEIENFINHFIYNDDDPLDIDLVKLLRSHPAFARLNDDQIAKIFIEIDLVIRSLKRRRVLELMSGIELTVVGRGWEQCDYLNKKNAHLLSETKYLECEQLRRKHQVSLNAPHGQPCSFHDRILHASYSGQIVVTHENKFIRRNFPSGNVVFHSYGDDNVHDQLVELLKDDRRMFEMARAGQDYMQTGLHGSDNAAQQMLKHLRNYKLI